MPMDRDLSTLPKAHLHLHLEGSARHDTIVELAARCGVGVDTLSAFANLPEFIECYGIAVSVITKGEDLERICYELLLDEAAQGVRWCEPSVAPDMYAPALGSIDEVWAHMRAGFERGAAETGIRWGAIVSHNRVLPAAHAEHMAAWAAEHTGDGIVGFGIAGDEALVQFAGVSMPFRIAPVMAHQFHIYLETEEAAEQAERQMRGLTVNGRQAMAVVRTGRQIFSGCHVYDNLPATTPLVAHSVGAGRAQAGEGPRARRRHRARPRCCSGPRGERLRFAPPRARAGGGEGALVTGKERVGIERVEPVGRYAVRLVFDDGHASGLFTWPILYELGRDHERNWQRYLERLRAAGVERRAPPDGAET